MSKFFKVVHVFSLPVLTVLGIVLGILFKEICFLTIVGFATGALTSGKAFEALEQERLDEKKKAERKKGSLK